MNQELINCAINTLKLMTSEERLEAFNYFCVNCGDIQPQNTGNGLWKSCQCWNDD